MRVSLGPNSNRSAQEMFSLIQEQQAGQLPVKAFCKLKNISEARYYYWRKKYLNEAVSANEPHAEKFNLLQLEVAEQNNATLFAEYKGLKIYHEVPVSYLKELMS
jgi:hypothetical protein